MLQKDNSGLDLHGLALVIVACAWISGIFFNAHLHIAAPPLLIGGGLSLLLLIFSWKDQPIRLLLIIVLCILLGAWRYTTVAPAKDAHLIANFIGNGPLKIRGTVSDEPKLQGNSRLLTIETTAISQNTGQTWQTTHGKIEVQVLGPGIEDPYGANYGDTIELSGKLLAAPPHSPPTILATMAFPHIRINNTGGNSALGGLYHLRVVLANTIAQVLPQPEAAVLIAILLGLRTPSLKPLTTAFNVTGTAHLIAPSGFKVTILAGIVASMCKWTYKRHPQKTHKQTTVSTTPQSIRKVHRLFIMLVTLSSIATYTVLSGAGPAAIRAGVMGILLIIAPYMRKAYNIYTALAFTALLISMLDPLVLWDAGFQLSFLGTLGIVLFTPYIQDVLLPLARFPLGHYIVELVAVTLAAQIATLPIFAITFQEISLVAPIANVLTVPLLATLIFLGILICSCGLLFIPLSILLGWITWPLLWYVSHIIIWCAHLPGAYIAVHQIDTNSAWIYYGVVALVYLLIATRSKTTPPTIPTTSSYHPTAHVSHSWHIAQLCLALLIIVATGITALRSSSDNGRTTITFLAVGPVNQPLQGEAILLRTTNGRTTLIDGGINTASLAQTLDSRLPFWQRSLDTVLLTTPRKDHLTGLQDIVSRYQVGTVIDAGVLHPTATYALWRRTISERHIQYTPVAQGSTIPMGRDLIQVLWPRPDLHKSGDEARDNSLIMRIVTPGLRILLLGVGAQSSYALTGLMEDLGTQFLSADIVQIVGNAQQLFPIELGEILQLIHPTLLVITPALLTAQQRKPGTLPNVTPALPRSLTGSSWQILQTAQVGTVEISSENNGWHLVT